MGEMIKYTASVAMASSSDTRTADHGPARVNQLRSSRARPSSLLSYNVFSAGTTSSGIPPPQLPPDLYIAAGSACLLRGIKFYVRPCQVLNWLLFYSEIGLVATDMVANKFIHDVDFAVTDAEAALSPEELFDTGGGRFHEYFYGIPWAVFWAVRARARRGEYTYRIMNKLLLGTETPQILSFYFRCPHRPYLDKNTGVVDEHRALGPVQIHAARSTQPDPPGYAPAGPGRLMDLTGIYVSAVTTAAKEIWYRSSLQQSLRPFCNDCSWILEFRHGLPTQQELEDHPSIIFEIVPGHIVSPSIDGSTMVEMAELANWLLGADELDDCFLPWSKARRITTAGCRA